MIDINNKYKKILIITAGRINLNDTANNGLLFRNLFSRWHKDKIAQVFNSGDNGDEGFFSDYYQLGATDRNLGKYLRRIKNESLSQDKNFSGTSKQTSFRRKTISWIKRIFLDTGFYELFFRPILSKEIKIWIKDFGPDLILAQGYSITFTELPTLIKKETGAKLIFFTTDDWPNYLYSGMLGENKLFSLLPQWVLKRKVKELICNTDIPIAFGYPMQLEYTQRYGKQFNSIIHCDDPKRFDTIVPKRLQEKSIFSIITIGTFNKYRWPLLKDINLCCEELLKFGIDAKVTVISDSIDPEGLEQIKEMKNIELLGDPGSEQLVGFLKGADLLMLIEGFDEKFAKSIELSISTKAHLYMFSKVPIIVYANSITGIAKYAKNFGWAEVIDQRDLDQIYDSIMKIFNNRAYKDYLVLRAYDVALQFHDINKVQTEFYKLLNEA